MSLETELLVPGSFVAAPLPAPLPVVSASRSAESPIIEIDEIRARRSEAAKRAWANSPKLQALRKRA